MPHLPARLTALLAATVLVASSLGCQALSGAKETIDDLAAAQRFAQRLDQGTTRTYTAQYRTSGGVNTTVAQQPPTTAYLGRDGRVITTGDSVLLCTTRTAPPSCQRAPKSANPLDDGPLGLVDTVAGEGFISSALAVTLLTAASTVPGVDVTESTKKVAGLNSHCVAVRGGPSAPAGEAAEISDLTACVSDKGVLTSFTGSAAGSARYGMELTSYRASVDAEALAVPANATVVDVTQLTPPPGL